MYYNQADEAALFRRVLTTQAHLIDYSDRFSDGEYEYRQVVLPTELAKFLPKNRLMSEPEWRGFGISQSSGWEHFMLFVPNPHVLMFRKPLQPPAAVEGSILLNEGEQPVMVASPPRVDGRTSAAVFPPQFVAMQPAPAANS
jgi:cyclin-dependent kinase regulatory subunit CKS1